MVPRPVARLFCWGEGGGDQIGQIWGPFMITGGLSCDRVEFGYFGGGQMTPLTPPLATGLVPYVIPIAHEQDTSSCIQL